VERTGNGGSRERAGRKGVTKGKEGAVAREEGGEEREKENNNRRTGGGGGGGGGGRGQG